MKIIMCKLLSTCNININSHATNKVVFEFEVCNKVLHRSRALIVWKSRDLRDGGVHQCMPQSTPSAASTAEDTSRCAGWV